MPRTTGPSRSRRLAKLADSAALPIRVYATVANEAASLAGFLREGPRIGRGATFLTVRAIKALADGALGSRGAALLADYSDEPGNRGLLVTPPERLDELALRGAEERLAALGPRHRRPRQPPRPRRLRARRRPPCRTRRPAARARASSTPRSSPRPTFRASAARE